MSQGDGGVAGPVTPYFKPPSQPSIQSTPHSNELAMVRGSPRQQWCLPSSVVALVRWFKPRSPDEYRPCPSTASSETSDEARIAPTRHFHVLTADYPEHTRETKSGKPKRVKYPDNSVSTAKYNLFTFIPRALFEQFRRLANIYFLVVTVLMLIGTYSDFYESPLTPYTTLIPLCVVLTITMGKEAFEDLKRHTADQKTNNRIARVVRLDRPGCRGAGRDENGEIEEVRWRDIGVGRVVQVRDREEIPADLVLLTSSDAGGNCYVETSNIDGETNLKIKEAARTAEDGGGPAFRKAEELQAWAAAMVCEAPNARIHSYTGTLTLLSKGPGERRRVAVSQANLLLRGSRLRNTQWALGLAVYTGAQTKIVMNSRTAPSKLSAIEVTTNRLLYLILGLQVLLVTVTLAAYLVWTDGRQSQLHYLCMNYLDAPSSFLRMNCQPSDTDASDLGMWITFLLLYNNFVPISLYVTVEMVNYIQAFYIDQDLSMYDPSSDTPALARTSNMNGDLGSVRYVFSDKTGTLTRNIMEFRRCSVGGEIFGNMENTSNKVEERCSGKENGQSIQGEEERASEGSCKSGSKSPSSKATSHANLPTEVSSRFVGRGQPLKELADQAIQKTKDSTGNVAQYFAECLAVCHTVVVDAASPPPSHGDRRDTQAAEAGVPNKKGNGGRYQAESPDEEALVEAAAVELGWRFDGRSSTEALVEAPLGRRLTYQVLATLPFTSTRKRMSVIVRRPGEGKVVLLMKGADSVVFERASNFLGGAREVLDAHLSEFASEGLRTLVLARRELEEEEFKAWLVEYEKAATAVERRDELMAQVAEGVERELTVIGATAIEDKLQEGVPETIAHLLEAGIKVWVLTGDKVETAINIAYSCRLLHSEMVLIKVVDHKGEGSEKTPRTEAESTAALRQQLRKLVAHFECLIEDDTLVDGLTGSSRGGLGNVGVKPLWRMWQKRRVERSRRRQRPSFYTKLFNSGADVEEAGTNVNDMLLEPLVEDGEEDGREEYHVGGWEENFLRHSVTSSNPLQDVQTDHLALVVDGPSLGRIFGDWEMERLLLRVARLCKSVVACRVSPAQKRMLIRLVKKGVKHPKPITLAIGDGANDVAMIQEAQVGVGISGREGRQAVNSADFAISQFRFIEPLLLKHGRWSYRRTSKVILYSFYKNIVLTFVLFAYTWLTGFSGQSLFEDYVYTSYNFMLAMPPICFGLFDRDISAETIEGGAREDAGSGPDKSDDNISEEPSLNDENLHTTVGFATSQKSFPTTSSRTGYSFRWVYMSGRENLDLNMGQMALWLVQAILDSVLIFGFSFGAMSTPYQVLSASGGVDDLYMLGLITFTGMLLGMLGKAATNTYTWTWVNFFFFFGSALLFCLFLAVYGALPVTGGAFYGVPRQAANHPSFWLIGVVLVPTVCVIVDYIFIYLRLSFFPSPVDIAVEYDRGYFRTSRYKSQNGEHLTAILSPPEEEEEEDVTDTDKVSFVNSDFSRSKSHLEKRWQRGWYPGKLLVSLPLLRRLNARVSQKEKDEMGLSQAEGGLMPSSYDYTSSSFDLGPGAGSVTCPTGKIGILIQSQSHG